MDDNPYSENFPPYSPLDTAQTPSWQPPDSPPGGEGDRDPSHERHDAGDPHFGFKLRYGALILAVALVSGYTGALFANHGTSVNSSPVATNTAAKAASAAPTESLAKVAAEIQPSVVSITVTAGRSVDEGSGVILKSDGTILTNNHVVAPGANGAGTISVKFADGKKTSASIVGRDPSSDIAVIKASNVSGLTPATLGSTSSLHVGDTVLAIGSPLGLDGSASSGIVSALHRTVDLGAAEQQQAPQNNLFGGGGDTGRGTQSANPSVGDAIQTDAAINPGNSGGPLVDATGAVVGIDTAIASLGSGSGSIGVGFAIPIEEATSVANQLIAGQVPKHALLGVQIDDSGTGALIGIVTPGGAAEKGGLQTGDVISKLGNTPIADGTSLAAAVRGHTPGDSVSITYTRNGSEHTTQVTLGSAS